MGEDDFRSLYEQLSPRLYSFAARRLSPEVAGDIVNETFEIAWSKRHEWPRESDARAGWVFTICKNRILQESQRVRRKHHDNRFSADYAMRPGISSDVADTVTDVAVGHAVYAQLNEAETELFDIAFMRDLGRAEAAAILGLSVVAFTTRVSRLRRRIESLHDASTSEGRTP